MRDHSDRLVDDDDVIGDAAPMGLCGSALVDVCSELLRTEQMNAQGRLDDAERFVIDADHDIYLSESDISELAQAKGANVAGMRCALESYGASFDDVAKMGPKAT